MGTGGDGTICAWSQLDSPSPYFSLAISDRQGTGGHEHCRSAGKGERHAATVAGQSARPDRTWRRGRDSANARGDYGRRRGHSAVADPDGQEPEDVADSIRGGAVDCLREHCQPDAGTSDDEALGCGVANGPGRGATTGDGADVDRERHSRPDWRRCRIGRRLPGFAHDFGAGISVCNAPDHRSQAFTGGAWIHLPGIAGDGRAVRRGACVAFVARAASRSAARRKPLNERSLVVASKIAGGFSGGAFGGAADGRHPGDQVADPTGTPGLWRQDREPLRGAH